MSCVACGGGTTDTKRRLCRECATRAARLANSEGMTFEEAVSAITIPNPSANAPKDGVNARIRGQSRNPS